jgi:hypothetical protein
MAKSVLSADRFHNEQAAFDYVEAQLWPNGPVCPHCGNADAIKIGRLQGKTTRPGLRKCYACRKPHHESRLVTDSAARYKFPPVASHEMVDHSKFERKRDDVHTDTLEGFFSVLKRGLVGVSA